MIKRRSIIKHVCRSYGLLLWQHQMGSYVIADNFRCYYHYVVSVQTFAVTGCANVHIWHCMSDDDSLYSLCEPLTSTTNSFLPTLVLRSVYKYVVILLSFLLLYVTCICQWESMWTAISRSVAHIARFYVFVPTHDRGNHRWAILDEIWRKFIRFFLPSVVNKLNMKPHLLTRFILQLLRT